LQENPDLRTRAAIVKLGRHQQMIPKRSHSQWQVFGPEQFIPSGWIGNTNLWVAYPKGLFLLGLDSLFLDRIRFAKISESRGRTFRDPLGTLVAHR
jgi:hypothetical protein